MAKVTISKGIKTILANPQARAQLSTIMERPSGVPHNIAVGTTQYMVVVGPERRTVPAVPQQLPAPQTAIPAG